MDAETQRRRASTLSVEFRVSAIHEYDTVRVVRLFRQDRDFDGTPGLSRAPKIGDTAAVVHEYDPSDPMAPVCIECVDSQGNTVWLADFDKDELELVARPDPGCASGRKR